MKKFEEGKEGKKRRVDGRIAVDKSLDWTWKGRWKRGIYEVYQ